MYQTLISETTKKTITRISLHVAFWAFYVLFFGLFYGKYGKNYNQHLIETAVMLPFVMSATYLTIYGILPSYLKSRKLLKNFVLIVLLMFFTTIGEAVSLMLISGVPLTFGAIFDLTSIYLLLETNFMVAIAFVIKFYKLWHEQQEEKYKIEKLNLEKELNLLKAQLHPHFLFNTMNNLYALSLENKTKTSEGIAKISDLLRSVLYECNEREIPLEREIGIIQNYIELEKMRYGDRLHIDFKVDGDVTRMKIAPMILFTFVENCFKHGCSPDPDRPYINIGIKLQNGQFQFRTKNSQPKIQHGSNSKKKGGVGLANVRKRLEILYPGKYELNCMGDEICYNVSLTLRH
ncbi:sensor histidine kinase [Maribellus sediminis]|uniref:sensor histidine kinase n=1 Tax=Maribellus sediminis TaxID=2696285 RepID=UPI0014312C3D|nr:histidine kinase [Maribellus sediminis]